MGGWLTFESFECFSRVEDSRYEWKRAANAPALPPDGRGRGGRGRGRGRGGRGQEPQPPDPAGAGADLVEDSTPLLCSLVRPICH